ncbi:unnamed protein product [Parnassius apollo]|uniref:(apollo) hypothetical protein n=1 Tax=Parnassius apollo TaxID=110799 RepID=A0A8S3W0T5_PARAO|nr:unnamed protein product [Parnassius apollo]
MWFVCNSNFENICTVQWVKKRTGKPLAIIDRFTYYCAVKSTATSTWRCTKGGQCKARFIVNNNMEITRSSLLHDHPPPNYVIRHGIYLKI